MGLLPQLSPTDVLVLTCPLCPFHSYLLNTIEEHFDEAHPDKMSEFIIYRCVHCHKVSTCRRFMLEHITLLHNTSSTTTTDDNDTNNSNNTTNNCTTDLQSITASTLSSISIYFSGKLYSKSIIAQNKCTDKEVNSCNSPEQNVSQFDNGDTDNSQNSPTKSSGLTNGLLKQISLKTTNINTCIFCNSYFVTFQELQSHYASHHGIRNINNTATNCNNTNNNLNNDEDENIKAENDENYQAIQNPQISVLYRNGEVSKINPNDSPAINQSKTCYLSPSNQNSSPLPLTTNNSNLASKPDPIITSNALTPTPLDFLTALNNNTVNSTSPLKNLAGQLQTKSTLFNLIMQQQQQQQFNNHTTSTQLLLSPPVSYSTSNNNTINNTSTTSSLMNNKTTIANCTNVPVTSNNSTNNNDGSSVLASQNLNNLNPSNTTTSLDGANLGPVGLSLPFPMTGKVPRLPQNTSNNTPPPPSTSSSSWLFTNPPTNLSQLSAQLSQQLASPILNSLHNQFQNSNPTPLTTQSNLNNSTSPNNNVAALLHQQMMQAAYVATLAASNNNTNNSSCSTTSTTPTTSPNTASTNTTNNNEILANNSNSTNTNNNNILSDQLQMFHLPKLFPSISNSSNIPISSACSVFSNIIDNNNSSIDLSTNSSGMMGRIKHEKTISGSESDRSSISLSPTDRNNIPQHTNNHLHDSINGTVDMGIEISSNNSSNNCSNNNNNSNNSSVNNSNNSTNNNTNSLDDNQIYSMKRVVGISRTNLPFQARKILFSWLTSHLREPYPSEEEKIRLANETGLSRTTVNNWFINARRRYVKPLLQGKIGLTSGVLKSMLENSNNPNAANALVNGSGGGGAPTNGINVASNNTNSTINTSTLNSHNKRKMITPNPIIDGSFLNSVTNSNNKRRLIQSPSNNNNTITNNSNINDIHNNNHNISDVDIREPENNNNDNNNNNPNNYNNNNEITLDHSNNIIVDEIKHETKLNSQLDSAANNNSFNV